jgi:hypothetical protein
MTRYRTERMSAGKREAVLEWSICPGCGHVRLEHWSLAEPDPGPPVPQPGRHVRRG